MIDVILAMGWFVCPMAPMNLPINECSTIQRFHGPRFSARDGNAQFIRTIWESSSSGGEPFWLPENRRWGTRLRRFDGEYQWLQIRAEPIRDEHGNVVRWYERVQISRN